MIKNFIYLDAEKLNSLSSQVFEGVTEYILTESLNKEEKSELQKGPISCGRVIGEILKTTDKTSEKKYLNDYSYLLFEKKLINDGLVSELDCRVEFDNIDTYINGKSFIKVKGKAVFNDMNSINTLLVNYKINWEGYYLCVKLSGN